MCNLSRVLARVLSILRSHVIDTKPEIHPLPGTASTPANIAVWLILTVSVLAGPSFSLRPFSISPLVKGRLLPSLEGGVGPSLTGRGWQALAIPKFSNFCCPSRRQAAQRDVKKRNGFPFCVLLPWKNL